MKFLKMTAAMAAVAVTITGCATPTNPELPYDRTQSGNPHVIGLIKPAIPERASSPIPVAIPSGIAGLLVGGTLAVMKSNRDASLDQIAKSNSFSFADQFHSSLVAALTAEGYTVKELDLPRDGMKPIKSDVIAGKILGVDAVLDISVTGYGFVAASGSDDAPYRPYVVASVQLLPASGAKAQLMKDTVIYNPYNNPQNVVSIPPDPRYNFVHFSDIEANPANAIQGMLTAADQTGQTVARLLQ